jgi:hypothetical protein
MTETQMMCDSPARPARAQAARADRPDRPRPPHPPRPRPPVRVIARLRALLRAPALLDGTAGGPLDVSFIEDDHRRLSGRRLR